MELFVGIRNLIMANNEVKYIVKEEMVTTSQGMYIQSTR